MQISNEKLVSVLRESMRATFALREFWLSKCGATSLFRLFTTIGVMNKDYLPFSSLV